MLGVCRAPRERAPVSALAVALRDDGPLLRAGPPAVLRIHARAPREHKRARSVPAAQRRTDLARVRVPVQAKPAKCPSWHCWLQLAASLVLPHIWQLS